jgi:hypothetical protein
MTRTISVRASPLGLLVAAGWLAAACAGLVPVSTMGDPDSGWAISGHVAQSATQPATGTTVVLREGRSGQVLRSTVTDWLGRYEFLRLLPGPYTLEVGGVVKSLDLGACDARVDVDLSSAAGPGTCR